MTKEQIQNLADQQYSVFCGIARKKRAKPTHPKHMSPHRNVSHSVRD